MNSDTERRQCNQRLLSERFFEIALWYSKKRIMKVVITGYEKAFKACRSSKPRFAFGVNVLRRSVRRLLKQLASETEDWSYERRKLGKLLVQMN